MSGENKKHIEGAALLRVLGGLAIVLLHTMNISELLWHDDLTLAQERLSMAVVYSLMWAVPVFIMVSGALLLDPLREMSIRKIYGNYVFRVVIALAVFIFIFRLFDMVMNKEKFTVIIIVESIYKFISNSSWSHLWYLYILIGLYLLLPAYRMIAAAADEKMYDYLFVTGMFFLSLIPEIESTVSKIAFGIQIPAVYTLYFFAGYGISSGKLKIPKEWGMLLFILGNLLSLFLMIMSWKLPMSGIESVLSSYASPAVVLEALGLFSVLWDCKLSDGLRTVVSIQDTAGFGLYLIHMIPLRLILKYSGLNPYDVGWAAFVFIWAGCYAMAILITALLRRIPFVRRVL